MDDPIQAKQQSALNQAISKYNHITEKRKGLEKEAEAQIASVNRLYNGLLNLCNGVQLATGGTHIGASQCMEALNSALQKCRNAKELLQEAAGMEAGGGGGVTHFSAGGSGRGDRGILVGPQISQACRQLTLQEESIAACRRQLSATFTAQLQQNDSLDTDAVTAKYQDYNTDLKELEDAIVAFAAVLSNAASTYAREQKEAIARAMAIPK